MKSRKLLIAIGAVAALSHNIHAAISVGPTGAGPLTFDTTPAAADFTTGVLIGTGGTFTTPADIDTAVAGVDASTIVRALPTSATQPPSTFSGGMRHNTAGFFLQSRPTTDATNAAGMMLATLQNKTGDTITTFHLSYDFNLFNAATEQIDGFEVYYSETGLAGSWIKIPGLSDTLVVGSHSGSVPLSPGIPNESIFYVLWVDDNGSPTDQSYTIDNLVVTPVTGNQPLSIAVTSPTNGQVVVQSSILTILTAFTGAATEADFIIDGTLYSTDATVGFSAVTNTAFMTPGSHTVRAVVRDAMANSANSPLITFSVSPNTLPTISITNTYSTAGSITGTTFLVGSPILVQALVLDDVGVTNVDWFVDGGAVPYVTRVPNAFNFTYNNSLAGTHTIHGVATDAGGLQTVSESVTITITNPPSSTITLLVTNGATWKYYAAGGQPLDDGNGTPWNQIPYLDGDWLSGEAELGDGDRANGFPEKTVIDIGPANPRYSAVYFRKSFQVANPSAFQNLVLRVLHDDGVVVYLNNIPIWTNNMPADVAIDYTTLATAAIADDGTLYHVVNIDPATLVNSLEFGENWLAAEVHQNSLTSSDLSFDLMFWGESSTPPALTITSPTAGQIFTVGSPVIVNIAASTFVTNAILELDGTPIGSTDILPFSITIPSIGPVGTRSLVAKGRDRLTEALGTSPAVSITVIPNPPPSIAITNVFHGANTGTVFLVGQAITNQLAVSDNSAVTNVDLLINGVLHFRDGTTPFGQFIVNDALAGAQVFTFVATDDAGITASASVNITVTNEPNVTLLVTNGSIWRYDDTGTDLGTGWTAPNFADNLWSSGPGDFGFGNENVNNAARTTVNGGPADPRTPTIYFRRKFTPASTAFANLVLNLLRDDGAVVHLNGNPVLTNNMVAVPGVIGFADLAAAAANHDGTAYLRFNLNPALLSAGENTLAVEVHQNSLTSSDLSFDLMLWGEGSVGPRLDIAYNGVNQVSVSWTAPGYKLQRSGDIGSPANWVDVPGNPNPHVVTIGPGAPPEFFQLKQQ